MIRYTVLLLLSAAALRADPHADLRERLRQFPGKTPVAAAVEFAFTDTTGDDKKPSTAEGRAVAEVGLGAEGLRIVWSGEQLAAVLREQNAGATKPGVSAPTLEAMSRLGAPQLHDYLDAASTLLRRLETAKLTGEQATRWKDREARLLAFKLEPPLSDEDRKVIKELDATAKVWLGTDGLPFAAESSVRLKGRALVVIGFEHSEKETFTFARMGDRLVVTTHERETADKGGGQNARSRTIATLRPAAP